VRPHIKGKPLVSIIIPTRDGLSFLRRCINSIEEKTTYSNYEILILDNGSVEAETINYFRTLRHRVLPFKEPFNFSRLNNFGASHARGSYLVLLNNDTEVISAEWLGSMLELCQLEGVGIVGAKLYYPDHSIQHAGVVLGLSGGVADHSHKHFSGRSYGYFGILTCIRNYSAVTAACMMVRKEAFDAVGGFDEQLQVAFNDVDFCLRVRDRGYRIVWTPHCELVHHESVSRGFAMDWREVEFMQRRWGQALLTDPYYNPNLTLKNGRFGLRI
jgi:GT2 family glycosyltransferase